MGLEILGITLFVLLIGASIALHEIGHLVPAKKFGVRVTDYMVGFGPTIWSKAKGETRYGLKAFPVGGYIRMIGMLPPGKEDPEGTARSMNTGRFAAMVAQCLDANTVYIKASDTENKYGKTVFEALTSSTPVTTKHLDWRASYVPVYQDLRVLIEATVRRLQANH